MDSDPMVILQSLSACAIEKVVVREALCRAWHRRLRYCDVYLSGRKFAYEKFTYILRQNNGYGKEDPRLFPLFEDRSMAAFAVIVHYSLWFVYHASEGGVPNTARNASFSVDGG